MPAIVTYVLVTVCLLAAELLYFRIAYRFNILDRPDMRSSHSRVTLRGGGVIFFLAVWLWVAFFGLKYPWFLAGLTVVSVVSFTDDVRSVPNGVRLAAQFLAVFLLLLETGALAGPLWLVPVAAVVGVGILNAYNFMDGINGITGGYSLSVLLPLIALDCVPGLSGNAFGFIDPDLLAVVTVSVLVFCFFNFRAHARCFAGDVGAVGIAFILLFALIRLIRQTGDFSWLMLLAVYGVDSVLTIVHRIQLREHLGQAHRKHAYQLLANELKIPHVAVSVFYAALQLLIAAGLIFLPVNHCVYSGAVLVILVSAYVLFMRKYYPLHAAYLRSLKS